jgi:hypothetical protein
MILVSLLARSMPATLSSIHCTFVQFNDPLQSKMKMIIESFENSTHVFMKLAFCRISLAHGIIQHWTFL